MVNFTVNFQLGSPIYEQLVYAVKKAIVRKQLAPGDRFPSIREISKELRISPNTARKAVSCLVSEKLLEIKPGIGSIVSESSKATRTQRDEILKGEVEKLVVEAKRLSITKADVLDAINCYWNL